MSPAPLKAPFPYFGGKSRVASLVWSRFGEIDNYVEPFAGSLAVLLARESATKIETVNDKNCFIANAWRAIQMRVRVCCGDWTRVVTPAATTINGLTGVFLDPPYSLESGRDRRIYGAEDLSVAHDVRAWCLANERKDRLRIALCGYEGEHDMPRTWSCIPWQTQGGYAHAGPNRAGNGLKNRGRERIWFSPSCVTPANELPLDYYEEAV
jgi:site-specific DNA-adenine methylase